MASRQALAVRGYRERMRQGGWVRCEVNVRRDDVELVRAVATALRSQNDAVTTRARLRDVLGATRPRSFKELLAACPIDDRYLDRPRDLGRDVDL